jgi:hypothetical protein
MKMMERRIVLIMVTFGMLNAVLSEMNPPDYSSSNDLARKSRKLIRGVDYDQCFDLSYNKGYADYLLDPFKANDMRGDWGTH